MHLTLSLLSLAALALAGYPPRPGPWTLGAYHPPSDGDDITKNPPWLGTAINANGGRFYIGKNSSAYCPSNVKGLDCSKYPGDKTMLSGGVFEGNNGTLSLFVGVPSGQQVYIAPDGALGYTAAHSTAMPPGSLIEGWNRQISEAWGGPVVLYYGKDNSLTFMGCKIQGQEGVFQVFLWNWQNIPAGCKTFQARTYGYYDSDGITPAAWQY